MVDLRTQGDRLNPTGLVVRRPKSQCIRALSQVCLAKVGSTVKDGGTDTRIPKYRVFSHIAPTQPSTMRSSGTFPFFWAYCRYSTANINSTTWHFINGNHCPKSTLKWVVSPAVHFTYLRTGLAYLSIKNILLGVMSPLFRFAGGKSLFYIRACCSKNILCNIILYYTLR